MESLNDDVILAELAMSTVVSPLNKTLSGVLLLATFLTLAFLNAAHAQGTARIGILGDIHGEKEIAVQALRQMRGRGVNYIIATGDFIAGRLAKLAELTATMSAEERNRLSQQMGQPDLALADSYVLMGADKQLEAMLTLLSSESGIPRERIFLYPGNWEHEVGYAHEVMNAILSRYGRLVFERYDGYGFVTIEGQTFMVSHFPQHEVPNEFLPPEPFRKRLPRQRVNGEPNGEQTFVMDTVLRAIHPPANVIFGIFAHTHIAGAFVDSKSGKMVVNPGVLAKRAKGPQEPVAYTIFDQATQELSFINAESNRVIRSVSITDPLVQPLLMKCHSALAANQ